MMQFLTAAFWKKSWPGFLAALVLAVVVASLGKYVPWLGGAGLGILSGVAIASLVRLPGVLKPGFGACGKQVLQLAVILLGAGLNLAVVWMTGVETLGLMLATISAVFLAAWLLGGWLGVSRNNRDLIASGTAICGGSAIAAVAPVIGAKDEEIGYSISVVFLFNLLAVVIFPFLGHVFGMSPEQFGIWAGTAVNDTSSVLAAVLAYSDVEASVSTATLVKMTRTVMIVPVALVFTAIVGLRAKQAAVVEDGKTQAAFSMTRVFPWFVLGFILMSMWKTWGGLPANWASSCQTAGKFLIVVALSGIGLNTDLRKILAAGARPMVLGACLWFVVAALALFMIGF